MATICTDRKRWSKRTVLVLLAVSGHLRLWTHPPVTQLRLSTTKLLPSNFSKWKWLKQQKMTPNIGKRKIFFRKCGQVHFVPLLFSGTKNVLKYYSHYIQKDATSKTRSHPAVVASKDLHFLLKTQVVRRDERFFRDSSVLLNLINRVGLTKLSVEFFQLQSKRCQLLKQHYCALCKRKTKLRITLLVALPSISTQIQAAASRL